MKKFQNFEKQVNRNQNRTDKGKTEYAVAFWHGNKTVF